MSEALVEKHSCTGVLKNFQKLFREAMKGCRKQFENVNSMKKVQISQEMVKMQCRKMPNWKAPRKDAVLGYWLKNLT